MAEPRHPGYASSQQKRKRVEEIFGWLKTVGLLGKVILRGVRLVGWLFTFTDASVTCWKRYLLRAQPLFRNC